MNNELKEVIDTRYTMMKDIASKIDGLPISHEWKMIFTNMCTYRTWFNLNKTQQSQMINIANVNSPAVKFLIGEHEKKVGLTKLEKISVQIHNEADRKKAMLLILDKGAKQAKNDIDLIISGQK